MPEEFAWGPVGWKNDARSTAFFQRKPNGFPKPLKYFIRHTSMNAHEHYTSRKHICLSGYVGIVLCEELVNYYK